MKAKWVSDEIEGFTSYLTWTFKKIFSKSFEVEYILLKFLQADEMDEYITTIGQIK